MARNDGFETRTLHVALAPELLTAVVREGGKVVAWSEIRIDGIDGDGHWQRGLDAFAGWVQHAGVGMRAVPLTVSVSARWCQLAMLPWSDALLYTDSARRYQQDRFVALYGSAARGWEMFCDDGKRGQPRLACAIDRDFAHGLWTAAHNGGYGCINIESVVSAVSRTIPAAPRDRFAVIETGRSVLVARRDGRIAGIDATACTGLTSGVPSSWGQWVMRAPEAGDVAQVVMFALDGTGREDALAGVEEAWHAGGPSRYFPPAVHENREVKRRPGGSRPTADRSADAGAAAPGR